MNMHSTPSRLPPSYTPTPPAPAPMPPQPAARRGPGPMVPPPQQQFSNAQMQQHQAQTLAMQERELAKRRARKPTDKDISPAIEALIPAAANYRELRELEKRYDAAIMRKRLDIQDAINRNVKNTRTLRIFVSNTAKDQPWQQSSKPLPENAFDFDTGLTPTVRVKIEGRLVDDEEADMIEANPDHDLKMDGEESIKKKTEAGQAGKKKFSHFFKSIIVELDRGTEHPDGNVIEWRKPSPNTQPATAALGLEGPKEFDGFEFERKSDENINCTIKLIRDESPDRFKLSAPLAYLLDTQEDTRAGIVMKLWEYVRSNGLQDREDRRKIHCDNAMRHVFHAETLWFPQIPEKTLSNILPLDPITIPYTIRTDVPSHFSPTVTDVTVYIDDPIRAQMQSILNSPRYHNDLREIQKLDDHIATLILALNHSKAKHDFWEAFAKEPAGFIGRWVSSQKRDLDTLCGEGASEGVEEEEKRKAMWRDRMTESVYMLLARQGPGR